MPKTKNSQPQLPGLVNADSGGRERPFPYTDDTGLFWRDYRTGELPVTDADGRLLKPFLLGRPYCRELWGVRLKLPPTPLAYRHQVEHQAAEREARAGVEAAAPPRRRGRAT